LGHWGVWGKKGPTTDGSCASGDRYGQSLPQLVSDRIGQLSKGKAVAGKPRL
jgi:hypothetical protein